MSIAASRFGPYELIGLLGAGGMGEVYRARDPRLNREVALKVLSATGAVDAGRQQRLLQEARAASALTHPNILAVYDVGTENGVTFIVSELVDGVSLREHMAHGAVPVREVLHLAAQMADGLAAAHEAGVVHRDLKPENVMVTRDGRVKLVDFGLAQVWEADAGAALTAPSRQATRTDAALLVGTVPYMSPEQARGGAVDFRSDQFALGLVVYELATGTSAFQRETPVQTLSAIIADDPPPIGERNPKVPTPLRWVIERCLAKEPRQRYAATADLAHDLRTLHDRLAEATSGTTDVAASHTGRRAIAAARLSLMGLGLVGLALGARALVQPSAFDLSTYRFTPLATDSGYQGAPAWSPDAKTIAYMAEVDGVTQVFTRSLGSSMRAQVTYSGFNCHDPFWSPDGTRIFYLSLARDKEGLWSVSAAGGAREVVMENVSGATISPDGKTLVFFREGRQGSMFQDFSMYQDLWFSSPPGAPPQKYKRSSFGAWGYAQSGLHFSPDGSKIGVLTWFQIRTQDPAQRMFWLIPWPNGDPYAVPAGLSIHPSGVTQFSWLADNRHIISAEIDERTPGMHLWLSDTQGRTGQPITVGSGDESHGLSLEGNKIWISTVAGGHPVRLTSVEGREEAPSWSPDATWIAYAHNTSGHWALAKSRFGPGAGESPVVIKEDILPTSRPRWAPTGDWIAYDSLEGLSLVSPDGKVARLVSEHTWLAYDWAADGSRLFGITPSEDGRRLMLASVDIQTRQERILAPNLGPVPLASAPVRGFSRTSARSFATSIVHVRSDIWLLEGFRTPVSVFDRFWPKRPSVFP